MITLFQRYRIIFPRYLRNLSGLLILVMPILISNAKHKGEELRDKRIFSCVSNAEEYVLSGKFREAIKSFRSLKEISLTSSLHERIQIGLIHALYKNGNFVSACSEAENFIFNNPTNKNTDYALYLHGLSNIAFSIDKQSKGSFFRVDSSVRDLVYLKEAYDDFMQLTDNYRNSRYIAYAGDRLIYLKNSISKKELSIIQFYYLNRNYSTVVRRSEKMAMSFPDTDATEKSLRLIKSISLGRDHQ